MVVVELFVDIKVNDLVWRVKRKTLERIFSMISKSKTSIFEEFYVFIGVIEWHRSNWHSKFIILTCIAKVDNCRVFCRYFMTVV